MESKTEPNPTKSEIKQLMKFHKPNIGNMGCMYNYWEEKLNELYPKK